MAHHCNIKSNLRYFRWQAGEIRSWSRNRKLRLASQTSGECYFFLFNPASKWNWECFLAAHSHRMGQLLTLWGLVLCKRHRSPLSHGLYVMSPFCCPSQQSKITKVPKKSIWEQIYFTGVQLLFQVLASVCVLATCQFSNTLEKCTWEEYIFYLEILFALVNIPFQSIYILKFKLVLEKAEEPEIKLPTSAGSWKKQESFRKTSTSALLTMPKPLTAWITINCGKFWNRWEYQTTWPASWETYTQIRKQQLELDMEQQTGSK